MTSYWVKGYPRPYPNLNTWHPCSNHEAIIAWADSHRVVPPRSWEEWRTENATEFDAPLDAEVRPRPESFREEEKIHTHWLTLTKERTGLQLVTLRRLFNLQLSPDSPSTTQCGC